MPQLNHEQLKLNNLDAKEHPFPAYGTLGKSLSQSNVRNTLKRPVPTTIPSNSVAGLGSEGPRPSISGQLQFRKKKEKSTAILVSIVVLFMLCHSYRLGLKIYEFAKPSTHVMDSFTYCFRQNR